VSVSNKLYGVWMMDDAVRDRMQVSCVTERTATTYFEQRITRRRFKQNKHVITIGRISYTGKLLTFLQRDADVQMFIVCRLFTEETADDLITYILISWWWWRGDAVSVPRRFLRNFRSPTLPSNPRETISVMGSFC